MPPVPEMLARGIPVAISTDGSGSADFQNIISAGRAASQYFRGLHADPKQLPAAQCLEMMTTVPAKMLGIKAGQLRPGYRADWNLLDLNRPNLCPTHIVNVTENFLWAADGNEVTTTMAGGVMVKDRGVFTTIDVPSLLAEVTALTDEMMVYREHAEEIRGTGAHK